MPHSIRIDIPVNRPAMAWALRDELKKAKGARRELEKFLTSPDEPCDETLRDAEGRTYGAWKLDGYPLSVVREAGLLRHPANHKHLWWPSEMPLYMLPQLDPQWGDFLLREQNTAGAELIVLCEDTMRSIFETVTDVKQVA